MSIVFQVPNYDICFDTFASDCEKKLNENRQAIHSLLEKEEHDWASLMVPLQELEASLDDFWHPLQQRYTLDCHEKVRECYQKTLPLIVNYQTEMGQNSDLYKAILQLKESPHFQQFSKAQKKVINNNLRDFKLCGVALNNDKKQEFMALSQKLSTLQSQFESNVIDATQSFHYHGTNVNDLDGAPDHVIENAIQKAQKDGKEGYYLTLDMPSYLGVIQHIQSQDIREALYKAFVTRASGQSDHPEFDNSKIMQDILQTRQALAALLDFECHADVSLATKMIESPQTVNDFLHDLVEKTMPQAQQELKQLEDYAKEHLNLSPLHAWDSAYASECMRLKKHGISQEELRPYFPKSQVFNGLFNIIKRLCNVDIIKCDNVPTWHPDVEVYDLIDSNQEAFARCYIDLYARKNKRSGAWMADIRCRRQRDNGDIIAPIASVNCNFTPPSKDKESCFTHDEVITVFHEFGHALQHMLTKIDYQDVSGINGIPWDAVEIPSQWLENWAWQKQGIEMISAHIEHHSPLPQDLFEKMNQAKNFQSAMAMIRQLEFSLFDFQLHQRQAFSDTQTVHACLLTIRKHTELLRTPDYNRFENSFSHIFAGGYDAGYYSYKWAEVMSQDCFSLFEEQGIFDPKTSQSFKESFLEMGGVEEPIDLFKQFRGREPRIDALLQHTGIATCLEKN